MADSDSGVGDDSDSGGEHDATSTVTISPSEQAVEENGRTYHSYKYGKYPLPNDEMEQDRLDLQSHLFSLTFGKLFTCPIDIQKSFHNVLDAGTGTGIWAINVGETYPQSHVTGIDLSHIQPEWVPPNVEFQVDDLEDDWTFRYKFGLIHCRNLVFSILDWPRFFDQSWKHLEPGGYIELADIAFPIETLDDSFPVRSSLKDWSDKMLEASQIAGTPICNAKLHQQRLKEAGFENIVEKKYFWPQNKWPRDRHYKLLGRWNYSNMNDGIEGMSMALFTRYLKWSPEEVQVFLCKVREELQDTNIHAFWTIYVVYGQKPDSPQV